MAYEIFSGSPAAIGGNDVAGERRERCSGRAFPILRRRLCVTMLLGLFCAKTR